MNSIFFQFCFIFLFTSNVQIKSSPIPVFYRKDTEQVIITEGIVKHLNELLSKYGTVDFWWEKDVAELIPQQEFDNLNLSPADVVKGKVIQKSKIEP